jgi:triacylglycerol lipase
MTATDSPSPAARTLPFAATRHPVVLVHGLLGFTRRTIGRLFAFAYFQGVEDALREAGVEVTSVALPATGSVHDRAKALKRAVEATGAPRVNLIAHSMGGLDARWWIGRLGGHARVASLVTVATPHRGTAVADWGEQRVGRALAGWRLLRDVGIDPAAFRDLTRDACEARNAELATAPEVPVFSVAGARPWYAVAAPLQLSFRMLQRVEGPNDGLVSVASARWGESWGTVEADHLAETGWHWTPPGLARFDHLAFYRDVVARLAARGY